MNNDFYKRSIKEIYKDLQTDESGLSDKEAQLRLQKNGLNILTERKKESVILKFLKQFNDFMIILLIFASFFSAVISYIRNESYIDSIIIIVIVLINSILSFIQERKADVAISELNKMFVTNCYVIRNGKKVLVDVRNIVVGDVLEIEAGDYVAADARLIFSEKLKVNEATLTGESISVEKDDVEIKDDTPLYDRKNMVYAGCNVVNGHAFAVVCATGMNTELGKIAQSLTDKKSDITPLQKRVNEISKVLTYAIFIIIGLMLCIGFIRNDDLFDVLMLSISLAVAAIPEGMSSIITIILSIGMTSMAKKNVIIRKMSSVETLGSTNIICSDKTGTITQNKMVVTTIFVDDDYYGNDKKVDNEMFLKALYYSHNVVKNDDKYIGDETEIAVYKYLEDINVVFKGERVDEYPFDSDRKMMSVGIKHDEKLVFFTKGSSESIINNAKYYYLNGKKIEIDDKFRKHIFDIEKEMSDKSLRVLAYASSDKLVEKNMIFLGLIGMMDPPRGSVKHAISICKNAGILPIMITGDSINTARAIAKSVGIIDSDDKAIEGKEIDAMNYQELEKAVNYYQVYARISPSTKLKIVETLQKEGKVVAMTGDGVNDAPAIQQADIGIGMGITGTSVTKKVADCILLDDSFSTIVDGVEEGRRITSNIRKIIMYLLAGNIIEVILVFVSMLLNIEMFSTLQLLWINLVTDSIPAIMLAFEPATEDIMNNSPENRNNKTFFTPFFVGKLTIGALIKSLLMLILFFSFVKTRGIDVASSLLFILLIFHELFFALSCRNIKKNVITKNIFINKKLTYGLISILIIQFILLISPLSSYFIVDTISFFDIIVMFGISIVIFLVGELFKTLYKIIFKDYVGDVK